MTQTQNRKYPVEDRNDHSMLETAQSSAADCVKDYPLTSAFVTLAAGLGTGFIVGSMIRGSSSVKSHENMASRIGNQFLNSMSNVIPDYFTSK